MKLRTLFPILALVIIIIVAACLYPVLSERYSVRNDGESSETGIAPDFTVTDMNGESVSLSDFSGRPVVISFWATWCTYCKSELPDFEAAYARYGDEVEFMIIDLADGERETVESAKKYMSENGYTLPQYFDTELSAAGAYSVRGIPMTVFVNADGTVLNTLNGATDEKTLFENIEKLINN